ncbi:hypothetical protein H7347_00975 [Corynebacterium sp. zg-331]|uniref:hypothetical protein n=1 Tax=unclassified Corynebacterium TaxID=2624378 RepID=UPI00128AF14E|nr:MULTISPECIES: hypothetical protein [unclassified Corynebacterium]MBC3185158.1 hypothetical protein [Corynebacterium sp. zg-331]MPV51656.1 hypothetical protein [Corynebacterium sp. zg331]
MREKEEQWFYHPGTGEVTQGLRGSWNDRMGPYATREEAERALDTAARRNDAYDAQDDGWD